MKYLAARAAIVLLFTSLAGQAADISGPWKLAYTTENGLRREATLNLKVEGDHLSGALTSDRGTARIEEGKVSGGEVSFTLLRKGNGDEIAIHYEGKVESGAMKLKMQYGRRSAIEVVATRIP
jgi:hypothetical protein